MLTFESYMVSIYSHVVKILICLIVHMFLKSFNQIMRLITHTQMVIIHI